MKKYLFFTGALALFIPNFFLACSKNEPYIPQTSPRNGVYSGKNLTVTIDGEEISSIKSLIMSSLKIPNAQGIIVGNDGTVGGNDLDVYDTSITFNGFPGKIEEITLKTVSTIYYFNGIFQLISIDDSIKYYEFIGTFTGDPYSPHSEQGLILEFLTIENHY